MGRSSHHFRRREILNDFQQVVEDFVEVVKTISKERVLPKDSAELLACMVSRVSLTSREASSTWNQSWMPRVMTMFPDSSRVCAW